MLPHPGISTRPWGTHPRNDRCNHRLESGRQRLQDVGSVTYPWGGSAGRLSAASWRWESTRAGDRISSDQGQRGAGRPAEGGETAAMVEGPGMPEAVRRACEDGAPAAAWSGHAGRGLVPTRPMPGWQPTIRQAQERGSQPPAPALLDPRSRRRLVQRPSTGRMSMIATGQGKAACRIEAARRHIPGMPQDNAPGRSCGVGPGRPPWPESLSVQRGGV